MSLTSQQLDKLIEAYADMIVDQMDIKDLMVFAAETIVNNMTNMTENEVLDEIEGLYDEEVLNDLIESVQ